MTDKQQNVILRKALVDVVQKLGEMPGWKKVEDGLPKQVNHCSGVVLGWKPRTRVHAMYYNFAAKEWRLHHDDLTVRPTLWMPMPATPTAKPTLAETLQAICASALGEIEVGDG